MPAQVLTINRASESYCYGLRNNLISKLHAQEETKNSRLRVQPGVMIAGNRFYYLRLAISVLKISCCLAISSCCFCWSRLLCSILSMVFFNDLS